VCAPTPGDRLQGSWRGREYPQSIVEHPLATGCSADISIAARLQLGSCDRTKAEPRGLDNCEQLRAVQAGAIIRRAYRGLQVVVLKAGTDPIRHLGASSVVHLLLLCNRLASA
jgi:hypothetical protein